LLEKTSIFTAAGVLLPDRYPSEQPQIANAADDCPKSIPHTQIGPLTQASAIGSPSFSPL
jgi:hypothetical protein